MLNNLMLSGNFYGLEIRHEIFGGYVLVRGFLGVCLKPLGFFGVLIFAPIQSSLSFEIQRSPPGTYNSKTLTGTWLIPQNLKQNSKFRRRTYIPPLPTTHKRACVMPEG